MERLLVDHGCVACHNFHGERQVGPPLDGSLGATRRMRDGSTVVVDQAYLVQSIYEPNARVVEGYDPVMPSYEGSLDEATVEEIAAYLAALR